MRRAGIAVVVMTALGLFPASTYAQQANSQQSNNGRKQATQTPDQGVDDDKTPPGQARKGPGERVVSEVPATVLPNGVAVAVLDESFDEAIVVTINPDGNPTYKHVQGTATAAELVQAEPKTPTPEPALEEK
jgi:hypothetical protein